MPQAMRVTEAEIINHAGLDSAVFLRIYILGLKIFVPMTVLALAILIPVNVSSGTLFFLKKELVLSDIPEVHKAVYNTNKFAKLVRQRDRLLNWLDYYQLKYERHPNKKPTTKKRCLGLWGKRVDSIEYY